MPKSFPFRYFSEKNYYYYKLGQMINLRGYKTKVSMRKLAKVARVSVSTVYINVKILLGFLFEKELRSRGGF